VNVLAIFGPTAVGKTGVAIAVARRLRERGEDPVAVSSDALQVYRGLGVLSGAPTLAERARLEHRLVAVADLDEEFSAGRFAGIAHDEIDGLLAEGRRPIVVGGTGLYLRAALAELELRPPLPAEVREEVDRELAMRGAAALHGELDPEVARGVHPNDRKRIARLAGLERAGIDPPRGSDGLWTEATRQPTTLIGLTVDRDELHARIDTRVDAIVAAGAREEVEAAVRAGASRTARAALGFDEILGGDVDGMKRAHRAYARRQLTWMRKMRAVELIDRTGRTDDDVAAEIVAELGDNGGEGNAGE
jgi:tRNA dimethylallyltransferase